MKTDSVLEQARTNFILGLQEEGLSKIDAILLWETYQTTLGNHLSKYSLPMAGVTDRDILDHLKSSGELEAIKRTALRRAGLSK
jgi:hypothetical protein